jgi:MFS family permease
MILPSRLKRIVAAYSVNRLGTWFGYVALSVAVFDHTGSALAVAALLIAGQVLPAFLAPAVIARVEASARRGRLTALYLLETLATLGLVLFIWKFWLPAVLLLVLLDGAAALAASSLLRAEAARAGRKHVESGAGEPSSNGELAPSSEEAERKANAALNIAFSGTFVLGPAIAGALVASAGASAALFIDAASFLICGLILIDLRPHVEEPDGSSVFARLGVAWQYIRSAPTLRMLLLTEAIALVFFQFSAPIEVAYAKVTLQAGDRGYGLLLGAWGVGVVVGSLVFARMLRASLKVLLSAGTLAVGLAYLGFAAAPSLLLACIAALIGGLGNGVQWASLISAVQRLSPQPLYGRMMGAVESLSAACPALGLAVGGALVAVSSPRTAFLVAGTGAAATTLGFLRLALQVKPDLDPGAGSVPSLGEVSARALGDSAPTHPTPLG